MLLAPRHGFVFLAVPKTGSTSIEEAFRPYTDMASQGHPLFKHTKYSAFQKFLQPFLASKGFPRGSYEVVCLFREPIDWLSSWWRYRSRDDLANPSRPAHRNYTGHVSFEEFVKAYMEGKEQFARVGRPSEFVRPRPGKSEVDRIFRYDRLDLLVEFLCEKIGQEVEIGTSNVSPKLLCPLSEEVEREVRAMMEPEYRIYEQAIAR